MKNQIQKFVHSNFGSVRVKIINEEPWFCLADLCKVLGLKAKHVKDRLDDEVVTTDHIQDRLGRTQLSLFVNEDGMYDVFLDSRKPDARAFRKWLTSEVLPQIRKTGGYIPTHGSEGVLLTPDEIIEQATKIVKNTLDYQSKQLEEMEQKLIEQKPKVQFAEAVEENENSIYIRELAKLLTNNGIKISQNQLFAWMRNNGYMFQRSTLPIQKWVVKGYFSVHATLYEDNRGRLYENIVTKVTGKGQQYFINLFINKNIKL